MIKDIILGHANELLGLNEDISSKRLAICYKCPLFKNILGGICNNLLYLNPETNDASVIPKEGYILGCGCRLKAKTTLHSAFCPAGKW